MAAKENLKSRILKLLREDEEFRYAVAATPHADERAMEAAKGVGVEMCTRVLR